MTNDQQLKCHGIIHTFSVAAAGAGAGLAQLPCSDNAIITPIQISMTISLARVFSVSMTRGAAEAAIATVAAGTVGRAISQVLLGWIPVVGNAINAATAATLTETMGWLLAKDFDREAAMEAA